MNRDSFREISRLRQKEAQALLKTGHYPGAYYLAGYAVECALKACIARQTRRNDFPDKKFAEKAWTHDLEQLVRAAGLAPELEKAKKDGAFELNWAMVKDWSESSRYESKISRDQAKNFYSACVSRKHGILSWIKKRW